MVGVTWKGSRSRSLTGGPGSMGRAASQPPQAVAGPKQPPQPVVTFRDKQSYQELFKPMPKPEPIPTLNIVHIECKSWNQLQKEREEIIQREIDKTKQEAEDMYNRVQLDDRKRCDLIQMERDRIENEQRVREAIVQKEQEERKHKDEARKLEIQRQEQILAKSNNRNMRSKTVDLSERRDSLSGGGIRVYHYKDEAVPEIVKQTRQEELRRKNSVVGFSDVVPAAADVTDDNNDKVNGHSNVHANGHANGVANGSANDVGNGSTNGAVNSSANGGMSGSPNGSSNGGFNGSSNGGFNGSSNSGFNSSPNGSFNGGIGNGSVNGQNGSYEATVFPQQTKLSKLPPRPLKETPMPTRQFQNGVESTAFMPNGIVEAADDRQLNCFGQPNNIYKSVMGARKGRFF